ncbi:hypothetical protein ACJRO7_020282 [Eucalyptus globulus]|uniref:Uncharacterized protein n=1 Tax=Eucalyptus globulus TaxID=34317 RepID=A0ABD3KG93_EUCGL
MAKALSTFWNLITEVAPETQIHNKTPKHIFLIPLSCLDGFDPRKHGKVKDPKNLVKVIAPNEIIKVKSCDYDSNMVNPNSQIYILFRAGKDGDVKKFLEDLPKKSQAVEVQEGEVLFLHFHLLRYPQFSLKFNAKEQVIREVNNADPEDVAVTVKESQLQTLIKQLENLKRKIGEKVKPQKNERKTVNEGSEK